MKTKTTHIICSLAIICAIGLPNAHAENWIKDAATGCALWNPNPKKHETIVWCGEIDNKKANGYGVATWKIRDKTTEHAEGEWVNGRLHGVAVWTHKNGAKYEGQWQDGQKSGFGIYTWPDGTFFMGEYLHDQRKLGRLIEATKNTTIAIQTSLVRELSYKAQDAAIQARKAATKAKLKNKNRQPQITIIQNSPDQTIKEAKTITKENVELLPIEDPSAK